MQEDRQNRPGRPHHNQFRTWRPRGLKLAATLATWFLILFVCVTAMSLAASYFELHALLKVKAGFLITETEAIRIDTARTLFGTLQVLALFLCVPAIATWFYLANLGARFIGAVGMGFSPFASIAWFAVPVAYLWMPYRAMREIWAASADPVNWKSIRADRVLGAWWLCWVLYMMSNRAVRAWLPHAQTIDGYLWMSALTLLNDVFVGVAGVLLIQIIGDVMQKQDAWVHPTGTYAFAPGYDSTLAPEVGTTSRC